MGDSLAIRSKRFYRRIHAEVAVRAVGILPALVPVNRCFDPRITGAKLVQTLFDPPLRFLCRRCSGNSPVAHSAIMIGLFGSSRLISSYGQSTNEGMFGYGSSLNC